GAAWVRLRARSRRLETVERERRERAAAMLRATVRAELATGQHEPVALPECIGVDDPARELFEARFSVESRQPTEVEQALSRPARGIFLDEERCAARIGLPRNLPGRIPISKRAQSSPFILLAAAPGAPRVVPDALRCRERARAARLREDDDGKRCIEPRPGPEEPEGVGRRDAHTLEKQAAAALGRHFELGPR